jgi:hypothetical protein
MSARPSDQLIARLESHVECWKQFNYFAGIARAKKFGPEDEFHFLELKKIIALDAETISKSTGTQSPAMKEITALIGCAPSLRRLGEMDGGDWHSLENAWHGVYIGWHSILGRLKIQQRHGDASFFTGKK